jgi:hypothetical protein
VLKIIPERAPGFEKENGEVSPSLDLRQKLLQFLKVSLRCLKWHRGAVGNSYRENTRWSATWANLSLNGHLHILGSARVYPFGRLTQRYECVLHTDEVTGSIPVAPNSPKFDRKTQNISLISDYVVVILGEVESDRERKARLVFSVSLQLHHLGSIHRSLVVNVRSIRS